MLYYSYVQDLKKKKYVNHAFASLSYRGLPPPLFVPPKAPKITSRPSCGRLLAAECPALLREGYLVAAPCHGRLLRTFAPRPTPSSTPKFYQLNAVPPASPHFLVSLLIKPSPETFLAALSWWFLSTPRSLVLHFLSYFFPFRLESP